MYVPGEYELRDGRAGDGRDQIFTSNQAVVPLEIGTAKRGAPQQHGMTAVSQTPVAR